MTAFGSQTLSGACPERSRRDNNGNLTGDGTNTYNWDAWNHMSAISGGVTASFIYDAFGRRASKTISGTTTQFLYDRQNPVQELSAGNPPASVTANLVTGLGIDESFSRTDSSGAMSLLPDALGSTIALTNSTGGLNAQYTYQPFGKTTASGPANANPYQFTGRENDGTGLYFCRARYYSPAFQRFSTQDPIGFRGGTANLYQYALGAPTVWVDPLGLDVTIIVNNGATVLNVAGHMTISVNGETPVGLEDQGSSWNIPATLGMTVPGSLVASNDVPSSSITITTTPEQDNAISRAIEQDQNNPPDYNLFRNNCTQEADKLLQAGGLLTPGDLIPSDELNDLSKMYGVSVKNY
ncbi:MAG TPA: RHS repeat-associated core domain-containing protein [Gemmataceae bacterium]|jgi:RHS repeat-associated protein|nr:RHS repeat-associated core domain-containing protein [Candidatus Binataceae bacterium]HEV3445246.1 RHS repeat-associated core domain-containing protein [Gemmataceae bacterium]